MATLSNNTIARAIYAELKGKTGAEQASAFKKIMGFFVRKRLLSKSKEILVELQKIINLENKILSAEVKSSVVLPEKIKRELAHSLQKRYSLKRPVDRVILTEQVEKSLLGGFRVEVNDEVIDLSVKNQIGKLQEYLAKSV